MKEKIIYKYKKEKILLNIVLVYPEKYETGMSSLGYLWVYHILQSKPWINCERAFLSGEIKTIETGRRLNEFDAIFFSISFENDILNIISILRQSGIEILRERRKGFPLIGVGGIATTFISNYLKHFADVIFSGDAEKVLNEFLDEIKNIKDKNEIISIVKENKIAGVYDPERIHGFLPYVSKELTSIPHSPIISEEAEFKDSALISVSKGCLYKCNFCLVSRVYENYVSFKADEIVNTARIFKGYTNRIGLIAATLSNHPEFEFIVDEINKMRFSISFSAFRIESLSEKFLRKIIENENKTIVIAPEVASNKLKRLIGKNIPTELIFEKLKISCEFGIKRIKLYFMIGLPFEDNEDINEIIELIKKIRELSKEYTKKHKYIPEIIVDINPFVPKPFTPLFQYEMDDIRSIKNKIIKIKNSIRNYGRIFVYGESPKSAYLQYQIAKQKITLKDLISLSC